MDVSRDELTSLVETFERLGLAELALKVGGTQVELSSTGRPPSAGEPKPAARPAALRPVTAPSVGSVRLVPEPGAPPYAPPGANVGPDDVVCVLDVWTTAIPVRAGIAGVVREVYVAEGELAEYGQSLIGLEPA